MDCLAWLRIYIVHACEIRKHKLYDSDSGPGQQLNSQSSPGDLAVDEGQRNGKFSQNGRFGQNGKLVRSLMCQSDKEKAI